jgi:transcriptional regulator with XRE-family HTH domain
MAKTTKKKAEGYAEIFSQNLTAVVQKFGWSQKVFGSEIGVSQVQARRYLTGDSTPPFETMTKIEKAIGVPIAELFRTSAKLEPRVVHHDLSDEIKAAVDESSSKANSKLMNEIFQKLSPILGSLEHEHGAEEIVVRNVPDGKLSEFINELLREPGLSADFYALLDSGADKETLRTEFLREIAQGLLTTGNPMSKRIRKILNEILAQEKEKKA